MTSCRRPAPKTRSPTPIRKPLRNGLLKAPFTNLTWAFVAPKQQRHCPRVHATKSWPRNAIDYFILARLEKEGLHPSPRADNYTLVRRIYLGLTGLPPTPEQVNAFINDHSPNAHERLRRSPPRLAPFR